MPIYMVLEISDEIEDVQAMLTEIRRAEGEGVTLDVGPYRFNQVSIPQVGTKYPT